MSYEVGGEEAPQIALEPAAQPDVQALIDALDAFQQPLYPPESHYGIDVEALSQPHVLFAVARDAQRRAIACGAMLLQGDHGEIKRMYVQPEHRGSGVSVAVLSFLEAQAALRGCGRFLLETGISQPQALRFYERAGYLRRGPFGNYPDDPYSVFMEKRRGA